MDAIDEGYDGGERETVVIRSPEDLIASVPSMIGFTPGSGSVVVVCGERAGGRTGPVARLDAHGMLGNDDGFGPAGTIDEGPARGMAAYCRREGVRDAHLVVVHENCADDPVAERQAADAADAFEYWFGCAGTEIKGAFGVGGFARGARWVDLRGLAGGTQGDPDASEIAARHAVGGRVRAADRAEIEALYADRDPDARDVDPHPGGAPLVGGKRAVRRAVALHDETALAMSTDDEAGGGIDDEVLAEVGTALRDIAVRDAVYEHLAGAPLTVHDGRRSLWWALARRRPAPERARGLLLLGAAAYFAGSGVHARAALDAAVEADPHDGLAPLLLEGLDRGISPDDIRGLAVA